MRTRIRLTVRPRIVILALSLAITLVSALGIPAWWSSRGVLTADSANDFAALNQGQIKNLATAAFDEMNAKLVGGAGPGVTDLIKSWFKIDAAGNFLLDAQGKRIPKVSPGTNDFQAVTQGQLKSIAEVFYNRLISIGYTNGYPWSTDTSDDQSHAVANLGQAKNLFSFDVAFDSDGDNLPDWWEIKYIGNLNSGSTGNLDNDTADNAKEYLVGSNPMVAQPTVTVVATDNLAIGGNYNPAIFTVTRQKEDLSQALAVYYSTSGATPGVDFVALPGVVVIPAGSLSAQVVVTALNDGFTNPETLAFQITQQPTYFLGQGQYAGTYGYAEATMRDALVGPATLKREPMIACGGNHAISLRLDGQVHAWGKNNHGQLGLGPTYGTVDQPKPVPIK